MIGFIPRPIMNPLFAPCRPRVAIASVAGLLIVATADLSAQMTFFGLGLNTGQPSGVSNDGNVVVGQTPDGGSFRWSHANGSASLEFFSSQMSPIVGVSADGNVMAGMTSGQPYRWTQSGGAVPLGVPAGTTDVSVRAISASGTAIVGRAYATGAGGTGEGWRAYRWTEAEGYRDLGTFQKPSGDANPMAMATAVSADGSMVAGVGSNPSGWTTFVWTEAGGLIDLHRGSAIDTPRAISGDGRTIVGGASFSGGYPEAYRWTAEEGFVRLATRFDLAALNSQARAVSFDGTLIVGDTVWGDNGFIWSPASGVRDFLDVLQTDYQLRAQLTGWETLNPFAMSLDGRFIAGSGFFNGQAEAWLLDRGLNPPDILPPPPPPPPPITPVPEPATYGVMAAAFLLGLTIWRRRRRSGPSAGTMLS